MTSSDKSTRFLNLRQAAEKIGISYPQLLKLAQSGKFPAKKHGWVWLVTKRDLAKYKEKSGTRREGK